MAERMGPGDRSLAASKAMQLELFRLGGSPNEMVDVIAITAMLLGDMRRQAAEEDPDDEAASFAAAERVLADAALQLREFRAFIKQAKAKQS